MGERRSFASTYTLLDFVLVGLVTEFYRLMCIVFPLVLFLGTSIGIAKNATPRDLILSENILLIFNSLFNSVFVFCVFDV